MPRGERKPLRAEFERDAPRPAGEARDRQGNTVSIFVGKPGGWIKSGTVVKIKMEARAPQGNDGAVVNYLCELVASPSGIDTPCVATVYGGYEGAWSSPPPERIDTPSGGATRLLFEAPSHPRRRAAR